MRLFLAVDPGDDCRHRLAGAMAAVRAATVGGGVRWVRESQMHVTLVFLGEVPDGERVERIRAAARTVAAQFTPFTASVEGGGVFPDWRRPRVVWFGIRDVGQMAALGTAVQDACADIGFASERDFRAHVTIGRIPRPLRPVERDALRRAIGSLTEAYPFEVTRVVLMQSEVSSSGSRYSEVASYPLGPA